LQLPPIFGRALRYDDIAELNPRHYYTFARGAFRGVEQIGHNVKMHFGHDPSKTLASTGRDTLRLYEHDDGLYFASNLGSLADFIERGAVLGASIAFFSSFCDEQVRECLEGRVMHVIRRRAGIGLNEISICIAGAPKYPGTWVATPHTPGVLAKLPKGHERWERF
jgi:phage head maturation protease